MKKTNPTKKKTKEDLLLQINLLFTKQMEGALTAFFDSLKGISFVFEQNEKNDYKQSLNYESIKGFVSNQERIRSLFFSSLDSAFKYFKQKEYNFFINENLSISNYQKIDEIPQDNHEVEIIMMLIDKAEKNSEKCMHILTNIFSEIASDKVLNTNQVPLSPFVVINSLVSSMENLDLSTGIRMIVYNSFDVTVMDKLNAIYLEIVKHVSKTAEALSVIAHEHKSQQLKDKNYTAITRIFSKFHLLKKTNPTKKNVALKTILHVINILQANVINKQKKDANYLISSNEIKTLLIQGIQKLENKAPQKSIAQLDSDTISLVAMLFKYIKKDNSIAYPLKSILLNLELPLMKVALQDKEVFINKTHSFRVLINKMSFVPEGFSDELNDNHKYILKLNEILSVILIQKSYNIQLYDNLLSELDQFILKMKKRFNLIQKRLKEKAVGLEKIAQVKDRVAEILENKMHDVYMPVYIRDLLINTWKNVLVLEFLRHPESSKACQSKVEFVELVLKYSQVNKNETITFEEIEKLVKVFSDGLSLVAFNAKDLSDKNIELMAFLAKTQGHKDKAAKVKKFKLNKNYHNLVLYLKPEKKEIHKEKTSIHDYFLKKAAALKVGDWLEFLPKDAKKIRAKISWISPITGRYLLVNSDGIRLSDKSPEEIAEAFRDKKCNQLQTKPLFDRALLEIAKEMQKTLKGH